MPFEWFMAQPFAGIVPAVFFLICLACFTAKARGARSKGSFILVITAVMWLAYTIWEYRVSLTMDPLHVPIRIDLGVIAPLLYIFSAVSIVTSQKVRAEPLSQRYL